MADDIGTVESEQTGRLAGLAAGTATVETPSLSAARGAFGLQTFRSLHHRDFRFIWFSTLFSSSGQWMQQVTLGWLTYQLTGSALLLGAVNGTRTLPFLVLGPFAGVAADRVDRKRLMLITWASLTILSAAFATLIVTGQLRVWHLFAFTLLTGAGWSFNQPVKQSVVPNLVPKADLMNALALNSAGVNSMRILGPALAGLLIAAVGAGENFYLQAAAYAGVAMMVLQVNIPTIARSSDHSVGANLKEGAVFVWKHRTLRTQMILALVPVVVALPYTSLMPVFAQDVFHAGPGGLGLLMAAPGVGALIGTLTIASLGNVQRKGALLLGAIFALGGCLVLFSLSRSFPLSLALLVLVGAAQMAYNTTNQTLIQLSTPDGLRGRVMGIYLLDRGLLPLGSLLAGAAASVLGAPTAVTIMGMLVSILALTFAIRARNLRAL